MVDANGGVETGIWHRRGRPGDYQRHRGERNQRASFFVSNRGHKFARQLYSGGSAERIER
jgi:hypothetical protein